MKQEIFTLAAEVMASKSGGNLVSPPPVSTERIPPPPYSPPMYTPAEIEIERNLVHMRMIMNLYGIPIGGDP
jgi:hypothetical protein